MAIEIDVAKFTDRISFRRLYEKAEREHLEKELDRKLAQGLITRQEAEYEYQDIRHRDEVWQEW